MNLTIDKIDFSFCYEDIFERINLRIENAKANDEQMSIDALIDLKNVFINYKNGLKVDTEWLENYCFSVLLRKINVELYDNKTKSEIVKINIEKYETDFSGGRNYYFFNKNNDTIAIFPHNEWMR